MESYTDSNTETKQNNTEFNTMIDEMRNILNNKSIESVCLVLNHITQLLKWYEQNGDMTKKAQFIDYLIQMLQEEKNK